jgi:hypothetical protein
MAMAANSEPLPTYESIAESGQRIVPTVDFFRLRWYISGPSGAGIRVMDDATDATSQLRPFKDPVGSSRHPVADASITDPPVSSVRVTANALNDWAGWWEEEHWGHTTDDGGGGSVWADPHPDDEHGRFVDDEQGCRRRGSLLRCCGEDRPASGDDAPACVVRAADRPFVTVGDFVAAVEPWLAGLDADLRRARGLVGSRPDPASADLVAYPLRITPLFVDDTSGAGPGWMENRWRLLANAAARTLRGER